jgi:ABC-2 type transport system ATP-binding protein
MPTPAPAICAKRLRLSANGRDVYPPLTFQTPPGSVVAILGAAGTGKTALLLTLAGRMRGWNGRVEVGGIDAAAHPSRVRRIAGLALMTGINDLAEPLTVRQHVAEQHVFVSRRERSGTDVLARAGIDALADMQVKQLDAEQRVRLGIALALVRDVRILIVDSVDSDLDQEERARVLGLLRDLADEGLTVVFACVDLATSSHADLVLPLQAERPRLVEVSSRALA